MSCAFRRRAKYDCEVETPKGMIHKRGPIRSEILEMLVLQLDAKLEFSA